MKIHSKIPKFKKKMKNPRDWSNFLNLKNYQIKTIDLRVDFLKIKNSRLGEHEKNVEKF